MTRFDFSAHFEEVEPGGPLAPVRIEQHVAGSVMRQKMETRAITVFSDFERVEVVGDPQAVE